MLNVTGLRTQEKRRSIFSFKKQRGSGRRSGVAKFSFLMVQIIQSKGVCVLIKPNSPIELYHTMLKQKILPVQSLIQCEAGRAKTKLFVLLGLKMAAV